MAEGWKSGGGGVVVVSGDEIERGGELGEGRESLEVAAREIKRGKWRKLLAMTGS